MVSLDSLPADQRAVLQLVLQRGRSYDEIARMLSIDRAAVRQRALSAFDTLGPQTGVPDQRRALITDYLLRQLPERVHEQTADRLAESASERAWARVLASELTPLASQALPEIPTEGSRSPGLWTADEEPPSADDTSAPARLSPRGPARAPDAARASDAVRAPDAARASDAAGAADGPAAPEGSPSPEGARSPAGDDARRPRSGAASAPSSRRGGLLLLGALAVIAIVIVVIVLVSSGGGTKTKRSATSAAHPSTPAPTGSTSSTAARVVAQINLTPPTPGSKVAGIAEILKEGATDGVAIVAQNVKPNTTKPPDAYAVWLYNSPTDAHILGFVNPGVTSSGRLSTAGGLPANASHYKQLIVTLETKSTPTTPGTIILQGTLTGL